MTGPVLAAARARTQQRMADACEIKRPTGEPQTNPTDGVVTWQYALVYQGPCRFQQATAPWAGPATVGQAGIGFSAQQVCLPMSGSEGITKDDIVTCTAAANDPDLVGRTWTVQGVHHAADKSSRRIPLQEIIG